MIKQFTILLALVLLFTAPLSWAQQNGEGKGKGVGGGTGNREGDCGIGLVVYHNDKLLWRKTAKQVAAMPEAVHLKNSRWDKHPGLPVTALQALVPATEAVEVVACGGRIRRFSQENLANLFLVPNQRGAFKLVQKNNHGRARPVMRRIGRIILRTDPQANKPKPNNQSASP